jgi:DHA2 family multidrug resistance protein-like MFS transporter
VGAVERRWSVLAVLCAALVILIVDVTVLHVAAPSITEDLSPSSTELLWIIDAYPLVVAPLLVASGTLGDRLGRKRVLIVGLVIFAAASVLAALAWSPLALIAARGVQGIGGALVFPGTMAIVRDVFPDRQERRKAVGIWTAVTAAGAAVGPLFGAVLLERWGWHAVFLVNVPLIALVMPFVVRVLPESRSQDPPPWDPASAALSALGVLGLAFGIKECARNGFGDPIGLATLIGGVGLLGAFTRRQLRRDDPLLDMRLFAQRPFAVAVGCVLLSMFGLVALELFFAQYLQLVLGLSPLAAAVRLIPLMVAAIAGSLLAPRLLHRFGTRAVVTGGLGLTTLALVPLLALSTADEYVIMVVPFLAMGFGLEAALAAANDAIISAVSADRAGGAAAIEETAYELGGGMGVAVLGSVLAAAYSGALGAVSGVSGAGLSAARESLGRAVEVSDGLPASVADALVHAARDAFVHGLRITLVLSIVLLGASALLAAVVLRPALRPDPQVER